MFKSWTYSYREEMINQLLSSLKEITFVDILSCNLEVFEYINILSLKKLEYFILICHNSNILINLDFTTNEYILYFLLSISYCSGVYLLL